MMGSPTSLTQGSVILSVLVADITTLHVDAIVNAANTSLLGGGGVDGAIHRRAGPELLAECRTLHGCKVGDAKATRGYRLPAKHIIHTVGPVWQSGAHGEDALLSSCYRKSVEIAGRLNLASLAFPAISTGRYRFPSERAAEIAVTTVREALSGTRLERVVFCCFDQASAAFYEAVFQRQLSP